MSIGCIIKDNLNASRMFGCQGSLKGLNINALMPGVFADKHDGWINRYAETGQSHGLFRMIKSLLKKLNGYIFP